MTAATCLDAARVPVGRGERASPVILECAATGMEVMGPSLKAETDKVPMGPDAAEGVSGFSRPSSGRDAPVKLGLGTAATCSSLLSSSYCNDALLGQALIC